MQLLAALNFAALASAAAVPEPAHRGAARAEATRGLVRLEGLPSDTNIIVSVAVVTGAPAAGAARADEPDYESASPSSCVPSSICFDGITCGTRYGGCYDKNFCAGSTSFPMPTPTCTDDPSTGLTQNFQKRMAEVQAARAEE